MGMKIAVIIPAAGQSKRFHAGVSTGSNPPGSKIEMDLAGRPVFLRAVELFLRRPLVGQIILAVNPDELDNFRFRWGDKLTFHGVKVVPGGRQERWETVLGALSAVDSDCTHVAIHDAARPLTSAALIDRVFEAAQQHPAVIPGLPVAATLKKVQPLAQPQLQADPLDAILGSAGKPVHALQQVMQTVDRTNLVEVQTPQIFELQLLRRAYAPIAQGKHSGQGVTDDAALVEAMGQTVVVVEGEAINFKITRPEDLNLARIIVTATAQKQAAELAKKRLFKDEDDD